MRSRQIAGGVVIIALCCSLAHADPLPGTASLTADGDLAMQMVRGIDAYLMRALSDSVKQRHTFWKPDYSSIPAYTRSVEGNRRDLRRLIGVIDTRVPVSALTYVGTTERPCLVAETPRYTIHAVRWPVLPDLDGEGLLLQPKGKPVACVVALPDADWSPEMLVGLAPGVPKESQFARRLAESGCLVLVPALIDRKDTWSGNPHLGRMTNQPHREFINRMAYELGRHIIGLEVQKVLAAVDWFTRSAGHPPVGVMGYGEGGLLALYSAAVDPRIDTTVVSGYFAPREGMWHEPIYRSVWGLLREFGDAELADLIAPRALIIECSKGPEVSGPPAPRPGRGGATPGALHPVDNRTILSEVNRIQAYQRLGKREQLIVTYTRGREPGGVTTLVRFLRALTGHDGLRAEDKPPTERRTHFDPAIRLHRQFNEFCTCMRRFTREADERRAAFWSKARPTSPARWREDCKRYRDYFWEEVIGKLPAPTLPARPRTRQAYDEPRWKGYEVMLNLYPDVYAYGLLLVPKNLKPGERRPVVVCQHGLEGRAQDVVNPEHKRPPYNAFAAQLADRGYVVYAPQNPYLGHERFRVLQRKAHPLKLSLFSFIVRQHERTLHWLAELPFVDGQRIGFYGLSYGGKTAMRVPAILPQYCLSICSADFNEWIWKNVSLDFRASYLFSEEYDMYEFDLGNTFNYADMAGLIAPRPFMVERGHDDPVGIDEWIAYEYAKVRRLYARLGLADRTAIEFFSGGHLIHGQGTFAFLDRWLKKNW